MAIAPAKTIRFGSREIGDGAPCFVTFEAGPTHSGVDSAKQLIDLAAAAGADAIKFQLVDPDRLIADRKQPFSYDVLVDAASGRTETITEPLYDILKRRQLTDAEWREVKRHSDARGLAFFGTVEFEDQIDLLIELGCDSVKIASHDVNYVQLLHRAARSGMGIQLDTGRSTLGEIESAIDLLCEAGNPNIIVHHCPSGYPAHLESVHLRMITTLKRMFGCPIAYSDHTPGRDLDMAAIALGANLVEKTITMDRTTRSVEHIFSLDPPEMRSFITAIRDLESALGSERRIMQGAERDRRANLRRSAYLARPAKAGTPIDDSLVQFSLPGHGISPADFAALKGRRIRRDLPASHRLDWRDIE
jgi:sialic acid synthase SpsE